MRTRLLLYPAVLTSFYLNAQGQPNFYWQLDETSGMIANDLTGTSNGNLQGNTTWQPTSGHFSGALRFYGNDARVDLGPCDLTSGPGDEFSVACWFKPEIVSGTERILIAKTIGPNEADMVWSLSIVNNTGARFRIRTGGLVRTVEVPPSSIFSNAWYHLAATYDGTTIRVFLNGSSTASGPATGTIGYYPQAPATMGNLYNNSLPFYGSLDDVRVYDHALSAMEVIDLVIGNVETQVEEARISSSADGGLRLPSGNWNGYRIMDMNGRTMYSSSIPNGIAHTVSAPLPPGLYLVCFQGLESTLTSTVLLP